MITYNCEKKNCLYCYIQNKAMETENERQLAQRFKTTKLILNFETGIFYENGKVAAKAHNIPHRTLCNYLNGERSNRTTLKYC